MAKQLQFINHNKVAGPVPNYPLYLILFFGSSKYVLSKFHCILLWQYYACMASIRLLRMGYK